MDFATFHHETATDLILSADFSRRPTDCFLSEDEEETEILEAPSTDDLRRIAVVNVASTFDAAVPDEQALTDLRAVVTGVLSRLTKFDEILLVTNSEGTHPVLFRRLLENTTRASLRAVTMMNHRAVVTRIMSRILLADTVGPSVEVLEIGDRTLPNELRAETGDRVRISQVDLACHIEHRPGSSIIAGPLLVASVKDDNDGPRIPVLMGVPGEG